MEACKNCGTPVETTGGVIDLNSEGLCEDCADRLLLAKIQQTDMEQSLDFDYSMNG